MNEPRRLSVGAWVKIGFVIALCLILMGSLGFCATGFGPHFSFRPSFFLNNSYNNPVSNHDWQVGSGSTSAGILENINLDWREGDVEIHTHSGSTIEVIDRPASSSEEDQVHWVLENGTLYVLSNLNNATFSIFPVFGHHSCEILIPERLALGLADIELSVASGSLTLDGMSCNAMKVDLASGDIRATNVEAQTCNIHVASGRMNASGLHVGVLKLVVKSGNVDIAGVFDSWDTSTASGNLKIHSSTAPTSISAEVSSGSVTFSFPEPGSGFTATVNRSSGGFNCGFSTTQSGDGHYVCGDGSARYSFSISSGTVNLTPA